MTKLEKELIYTFNNISAEKMNAAVSCINPAEFALPDKEVMEMTRNRVNDYVNHNSKSKYSTNRSRILSMVAAAVLVFALTMTFSKTARAVVMEPIKKIIVSVFHYVPGEGMVEDQIEEEVTNEVIVVNELAKDASAYYVLKNEGAQVSNGDISIELQRATLHEKTIEISYLVDLLKVDENEMNEVLMEAIKDSDGGLITPEYLSHYVRYYKGLGYNKYFRLSNDIDNTFDAVKEPLSELKYIGNELNKIESFTFFGETSDGKKAVVTEKYVVEDFDISNSFILSIAGVEVPIELKYCQEYETQDELINDYNGASLQEGIRFITNASRDEDKLKAEISPIDMGKYDRIMRFWPVAVVNGKEYPGYVGESFRDENELCTDYEFNIPIEEDFDEFEIKITDCMVIANTEGITVGLPEKEYGSQIGTCDGVIDGFKVQLKEAKYLSKDEADCEWGDYVADIFAGEPGDRIGIKLQVVEDTLSTDDNIKFYGFQKILVSGDSSKNCKVIICGEDRSEYCICPLATKEEINSLLFTDPIYIIKDCGSMVVDLQQ